ncbi:head maturation protease, ClpP-related [Burkholderia sp. USMB20]|uniref:head maturation protease, ClpP-related n=1 Tax=Burkholderia sp. USMB20 TaxID=1571773 RepID=UPI0005CE9C35|nr:head maturation protease, ClpP-related [Burkholderia sp. USMB20]TGN96118.1 Clp protease ClpP [Burkholderia sp. USMB20]
MTLLSLPEIRAEEMMKGARPTLREDAVARWNPEVQMAVNAADANATISMYGQIGETWDGTGITSNRIAAALRNVGAGKDVVVNINSPGGDFFEGVAIYNLLRQHDAHVTVNIMSLAASAASVVAMAGDVINIGEGAFLMIHNAWSVVVGNRNDLKDAAKTLGRFDDAMASLYAKRTGMSKSDAQVLMDKESWIGADDAVKQGFATGTLGTVVSTASKGNKNARALALVEASLTNGGYSAAERREVLAKLSGATLDAAPAQAQSQNAVEGASDVAASLQNLINLMGG